MKRLSNDCDSAEHILFIITNSLYSPKDSRATYFNYKPTFPPPEGAVERSVSSPSYQGSTQLTQIPMLSMSQSPRKTDSPRNPFIPNSHRSVSSTEGGRCLPSTPLRNPSAPPQIVIRQQSQGSEDGAAREMDVAASLLLGEEAFFAEFSGDIFGTSAEGDRASRGSEKDDNDMEYDGQQNRDSQTRQVCLLSLSLSKVF